MMMTPRLQRAIQLLSMTRADFVAELRKELADNPVLRERPRDAERRQSEDFLTNNDDFFEFDDSDVLDLDDFDRRPTCDCRDAESGITPDVCVGLSADELTVFENVHGMPALLVDEEVARQMLAASGEVERVQAAERLHDAQWLIRSAVQRTITIIRVAECIVREQASFFVAEAHVKPLTARQVAEAVGMHEATIARIAHGKYLHCSRGLFELGHFLLLAVS